MAKSTARSGKKKLPAKKRALKQEKKILPPLQFPVVAIGASAGGVEASRDLLKNISSDLGIAYVFVNHLSPSHESHLPEILQRETSMVVHKVTNRLRIEPNNVYVIPPNSIMTIEDGHLVIQTRTKRIFIRLIVLWRASPRCISIMRLEFYCRERLPMELPD